MRNKINLKFNNKSYAFSLIEAMIILVLVSVGIMALVPLITQKTDLPRWIRFEEKNAGGEVTSTSLFYGRENANMTRIGFFYKETEPNTEITTDLPAGKMEVADSIKTTNGIPYTSVMLGGTMVDMTGNYTFPASDSNDWLGYPLFRSKHYGANSIVMGQGNITSAVSNAIVIGYNTDLTSVSGSTVTNVQPAKLYGANTIQLGTNGNTGLDYAADRVGKTIYQKAGLIEFKKFASPSDAVLMSIDSTAKLVEFPGEAVYVDGDVNISSACTLSTTDLRTLDDYIYNSSTYKVVDAPTCIKYTPSDSRLKNVYGSYNKGADSIKKIDTYKYTYKNSSTPQVYTGVIAQNLIGIFEEALSKSENGYYAVDKTPIMYAMINAVKSINNSQKDVKKEQKEINKELDFLIKKAGKK